MADDRQAQRGRTSIKYPGYAERVDAAIRRLLRGAVNYSEIARRSNGEFPQTKVPRLAKSLPADLETLEKFARVLEVPWQWLVVGDDCAEDLLETRKRMSLSDQGVTLPLAADGARRRRPPPGPPGAVRRRA